LAIKQVIHINKSIHILLIFT